MDYEAYQDARIDKLESFVRPRTYRPVPADRVLASHSLNRTLRYVTGRVRTSRLNVYWGEMLHKKDADCWARRRQIE
jgi:hypothetical protein